MLYVRALLVIANLYSSVSDCFVGIQHMNFVLLGVRTRAGYLRYQEQGRDYPHPLSHSLPLSCHNGTFQQDSFAFQIKQTMTKNAEFCTDSKKNCKERSLVEKQHVRGADFDS